MILWITTATLLAVIYKVVKNKNNKYVEVKTLIKPGNYSDVIIKKENE